VVNERPHKKLLVWQKAVDMVIQMYDITDAFPREEEFGLKSQLRRAAVSVPSNIAEGLTRRSKNDRVHFLNIAQSSLSEIDTQVEIAFRIKYLARETYESVVSNLIEVQKLLSGLSWTLER
jgi:four helix bundle protein